MTSECNAGARPPAGSLRAARQADRISAEQDTAQRVFWACIEAGAEESPTGALWLASTTW
jgi:hypothetical protein